MFQKISELIYKTFTSVQNVEYLFMKQKLYCKSNGLFLTDGTD